MYIGQQFLQNVFGFLTVDAGQVAAVLHFFHVWGRADQSSSRESMAAFFT